MVTAASPRVVAQLSESVRVEEFDQRMIDAHRRAFASKRRPLTRRHRLADMFRESPRYVIGRSQRAAFDALIEAGADDDLVLAIADQYVAYVRARIAERNQPACVKQALRNVFKESGEAAVAQLVLEQEPTAINRERAERETLDAIRAKEHYLVLLYHRAGDSVRTFCRNIAHAGG